jgi:hypothetical protein
VRYVERKHMFVCSCPGFLSLFLWHKFQEVLCAFGVWTPCIEFAWVGSTKDLGWVGGGGRILCLLWSSVLRNPEPKDKIERSIYYIITCVQVYPQKHSLVTKLPCNRNLPLCGWLGNFYQMSVACCLLRVVRFRYTRWQVIKILRQMSQTCSLHWS